ncbi:NAD(P)-dependent oxidoreductase [Streptomyces sp. NBRC 14336]|uniref:NmrA family NAD(P)-binding protein n=1 Tax=Streptomyces sp. NBRC 14336 TaxID=3030992 RepID=UPI0024A3B4EF|nr:NAD(P)H-binding protein [Streptomyces sp. NBRC 14336]WBO77842.1 NAD(P)H-binding protein [Streptomyces sp. SBE_14.2]GLW45808.1 NAD(P)-dependent oxidoreductase [Streptomyces sp. NBRC 14336]
MILVTGVSGALGGLVYRGLSALDGVDAIPGTRTPGARTPDARTARRIDFDDPATLTEGFAGVDVLVLISAGYAEDDIVMARHDAAAEAAAAAGIRHVIYTSLAASGDHTTLAAPHRWTESRLSRSPFTTTVLRNGLYAELLGALSSQSAARAAETGVFEAAYGSTGRMSVVARQDLADVTVRVAAESDRALAADTPTPHANRTYELEGATALGGEDIADLLTKHHGTPITYHPTTLTSTRAALLTQPLEPYQMTHTLSLLSNTAAGFLASGHSDLPELLGTAPRRVHDLVVDAALSPR